MNENEFIKKITDLKESRIPEIIVTPDEFPFFRLAWLEQEDRKFIVGEAGLNGRIIYRYTKNMNDHTSKVEK